MNSRTIAYRSFVVTQDDQHWECRPSVTRGEAIPLIFATVGAGSLCGAVAFWLTANAFIRVAFCIPLVGVAAPSIWQAVRAWRLRTTPLTVESSGRVSYGEHEFCTVESVRKVRVMPDPGSETNGYTVRLELVDGQLVKLPGFFLGDWSERESARLFATEFAKALKAEISDAQ
jgi:hypothetical protein